MIQKTQNDLKNNEFGSKFGQHASELGHRIKAIDKTMSIIYYESNPTITNTFEEIDSEELS